jgi:formylglycine-generating enzyme required for sulfatase activity
VGLFYYAGHGMQVRGANYLIPVGMDISSEDEVPVQGLDVNAVLGKMDTAKNRVNLLILDACRNNPFARSFRSASRGLTQMEAPSGSFVAFATAPGSTASDGEGQNGLYTQHLLKALQQRGLNVEQVFKQVRISVKKASRDQQVPWDSSSLTGEFYFRPGTVSAEAGLVAVEPALTPTPALTYLEGAAAEQALTKDSFETQAEFEVRLKKIPFLRVGTVTVDRKNYNLETKQLLLPVQVEPWAKGLVKNWPLGLELDRAQAKALAEDGASQPLLAIFEWSNGTLRQTGLTIATPLGALAPHPGPAPVAGASRNTFGLWETRVRVSEVDLSLVQIPSGSFRMGTNATDAEFLKIARPVHQVTLSQVFWMGKVPVTQGQWQAVMGNNPSKFKNAGVDAPVEKVSWDEAQQFISTLNGMQSEWTFRLPMEAEWEYACRAGTEGEAYGPLDAIAWYKDNSGETTHPVGQKQPNAFGLYDMNGNVWQWCWDWFGDYPADAQSDPQGHSKGQYRVFRGGSWSNYDSFIRSAGRAYAVPVSRFDRLGFRVCAVARAR